MGGGEVKEKGEGGGRCYNYKLGKALFFFFFFFLGGGGNTDIGSLDKPTLAWVSVVLPP